MTHRELKTPKDLELLQDKLDLEQLLGMDDVILSEVAAEGYCIEMLYDDDLCIISLMANYLLTGSWNAFETVNRQKRGRMQMLAQY